MEHGKLRKALVESPRDNKGQTPTCMRAMVIVITTCLSGRDGESSAG